mmetsp:Transcript_18085/g.43770  ORF Transcript_18085/g.43770 Transcript_18085/m.43770 type:complete len:368 (-) Transcript_18085:131-1234(-)
MSAPQAPASPSTSATGSVPTNPSLLEMRTPPPNLRSVPFPWRLHEMLDAAEVEGFESIVSWLPNGRSFRVHDPVVFVDKVMKKFFNQNKYKSFQRQLNIWGFVRILDGPAKGGYLHEHLVQNQPEMCAMMKRQKIKGSASQASTQAAQAAAAAAVAAVAATTTTPAATAPAGVYPAHQQQQQQQQQMIRSTSIVSALTSNGSDQGSISSDSETSSLNVPMQVVQHSLVSDTADRQQYQQHYQYSQQQQQGLKVWNGQIITNAPEPVANFEGEMFFLLGEDGPSVAPPLLPTAVEDDTEPLAIVPTIDSDSNNNSSRENHYRSNRRLSLQLFAASQGENTGMPGIDQLFADLEASTDALQIFNRSIAA